VEGDPEDPAEVEQPEAVAGPAESTPASGGAPDEDETGAETAPAEEMPAQAPDRDESDGDESDGEPDGDDEPDEDDAGGDEVATGPAWPRRAELVGWGLIAVVVILLLGTLAEAIAAGSRQGSLLARLGAAFVGQAGTSDGLALLAAAGLACWARAERLLLAALVAAVVVCAATPLAMLGDVSNVRHVHQPVNGLLRWELLTFFGVTFVPAALAAMVAWWGRADGLARLGTDT
jgi:hypothetical protein